MSHREQKKYFEVLRRFERKLSEEDYEDYKIMLGRHKDDEDLDKESFEKLKELYTKYYLNREKKSYDHLFKKIDDES